MMKLTRDQHDCPYCHYHDGAGFASKAIIDDGFRTEVKLIKELDGWYVYCRTYENEVESDQPVSVCPMCGRDLRSDKDGHDC